MTELFSIDSGDQVGTYRVLRAYPQGGYRAIAIGDDTARVHLELSSAEDWRDRAIQLLRAKSIVGTLAHAGIARIHGCGVLPDRRPWVASELAEGVPLCDVFARRLLTVDETVALVRDLAEIAAHAHARRVVHGAIRPHLVVMRTGEKQFPLQLGGWSDLRSRGVINECTPAPLSGYTAPELARTTVDGRVDVYSIGVIAHRGLLGKFPGMVTPDVITGVPALSKLLVGMLAIDPAERMTAREVLAASGKLCGDRVLSGPRFTHPRWTPAPLPDGDRVASVIDLASARRDRS